MKGPRRGIRDQTLGGVDELAQIVGDAKIPEESIPSARVYRYDMNIVCNVRREDGIETIGGRPMLPFMLMVNADDTVSARQPA